MKLFHSTKNQQADSAAKAPAMAAIPAGLPGGVLGMVGLDDFGIIGTHHLPLDWLGANGDDLQSGAGPLLD